ncbi:MAG TPA: deiodinase family protein, partial [Planctomycetia bacterium]|nr:deiodinase family protein [Planctomycetia bacterium]
MTRLHAGIAAGLFVLAGTAFADDGPGKSSKSGDKSVAPKKADARPAPSIPKELEAKAKALIAASESGLAAIMAKAILDGSQLGPGEGWFKVPPQKMYGWKWVADRHRIDEKAALDAEFFKGPAPLFEILDRNGDGSLAASDFDWSPDSQFAKQMQLAAALFRPNDRDGDGRLSKEEWNGAFARAKSESLSQESVRRLLFPNPPKLPKDEAAKSAMMAAMGGPTPEILIKGLFAGEVGSMQEGPNVGDAAPDFTLSTADGKTTIRLKDKIGAKPVVLICGNYSCGPYRSWSETFAELARRFADRAVFLGIYVREAHPTDGWRMESNDRAGISYAQPRTDAERRKTAATCNAKLKLPFPVLVDGVDDMVGNLYSGMPGRFYVIDAGGRVTYKSARGPFGFKPQELEQNLALTLLAAEPVAASAFG